MLNLKLLLFLLSFVLLIIATEADTSLEQLDTIIELHKKLRKNHNTPALKWDSILAIQSKQFVESCQYNSKMDSSLISKLLAVDNVARGYNNWNQTINAWYNGNKYYDYDNPGYTDDAGTFITMIWKETTRIGCAIQDCPNGLLYHCLYSPSIPIPLLFNEKEYQLNVQKKSYTMG